MQFCLDYYLKIRKYDEVILCYLCLKDHYQRFVDAEDISKIPKEEDPFWEPTEDVLIGTANVFLQSLSYALDFDDKLAVTDYKVRSRDHRWKRERGIMLGVLARV